ncbi:uncharacterized protein Pyn_20258 [Prunus yedoensis var. nudiflora]|uniref:Uncharacterized protein n=1 Tax=Prunus yedoensis var. nudiflora TaxID=2094558 RepID=A0A314YCL2_PRUYE|nr:uncharacterized protein Pyn_20258 [Prunus yedoensis var. nudiflora]
MVSSSAADAGVDLNQDSCMGNLSLCDDLLCNILFRLSQKDLVKCKMVAKSWHKIISHVWLRRFWSQSPVLGIFFRTLHPPDKTCVRLSYIFLDDKYFYLHKPSKLVSREYQFRLVKSQMRDTSDYNLDCCNGLFLLFHPDTYQFCVFNPITKQHVSIPKARPHEHEHFCAALAFDPLESNHYRVVRIDYSQQQPYCSSTSTSTLTLFMDVFSSQSGEWVRRELQLNPMFIEGFKSCKVCSHFVYLRGVLYSLASSRKLLCIDLKIVQARALELPHVPEDDEDDITMGCLGVSMDLVCYVKRDSSNVFRFWSYDDRLLICSYDFKSEKVTFVHEPKRCEIAPLDYHLPFFALRACLISLGERNASTTQLPLDGSKGTELLSVEVPCRCGELKCEFHLVGLKFIGHNRSRFTLPTEMELCAAMELLEVPSSPPQLRKHLFAHPTQ